MTSLMRLLCSLSNSVVSQFYDFVEFKNVSFNVTNMISVIRAQCEGPSVIQGLFRQIFGGKQKNKQTFHKIQE